jgi:hypothetical protein
MNTAALTTRRHGALQAHSVAFALALGSFGFVMLMGAALAADKPVDVYALCSFGQGKCGMSNMGFDQTRPQDLTDARLWKACIDVRVSTESNYDAAKYCTRRLRINLVNPESYTGPRVNIDGGSAAH